MRLCERNLTNIYYATFKEEVPILDDDYNETGDYKITYNNPEKKAMNVSAARGVSDVELFGVSLDYEKVAMTGDMSCPIDETTALWVDVVPTIKEDGSTDTPYDYEVVKVAKSLNYIAYAIKKVKKS